MSGNMLEAISPIDGRYAEKVKGLSNYFSEYALMQYRSKVEVLYFLELAEFGIIRKLSVQEKQFLERLWKQFSVNDAEEIKNIEKKTNHDVKAVEYFIKQKITKTSIKDLMEFVHFGLTSEDVTNLAYGLAITDFLQAVYLPTLRKVQDALQQFARQYKGTVMLARTHGQIASPTTVGKEFAVYAHRLQQQLPFDALPGKLNGAVGNYHALQVAYPKKDWIAFSKKFIQGLGLVPNLLTTQIESHDGLAKLFHQDDRINNILIDLARDCWLYIGHDYLVQKAVQGEVGSSTMPHKVNPIDFENAEGNLAFANAIFIFLADWLQKSRLQRDLTDSTVQRNIGVAFAHSILGYQSLLKGLGKIIPNTEKLKRDLAEHPEVLAEAMQTILRREGAEHPYEQLKELTRGKKVTIADIHHFIDGLKVSENVKKELRALTPEGYIGLARELVK